MDVVRVEQVVVVILDDDVRGAVAVALDRIRHHAVEVIGGQRGLRARPHLLATLAVAVREGRGVEHGVREELVVKADRLVDVARREARERTTSEPRHRRTGLRDLPAKAKQGERRVDERERLAVDAEHTGEKAAPAGDDAGVEDHHVPEPPRAERRERAEPRLDGADHVRVHAAHRVTACHQLRRIEVVRGRADRQRHAGARGHDGGRDLELEECIQEQALLEHALLERVGERREVVDVEVRVAARTGEALGVDGERARGGGDAALRDDIARALAHIGDVLGGVARTIIDDVPRGAARAVEELPQGPAARGHGALRDRDRERHGHHALRDRCPGAVEAEPAFGAERRGADLVLRIRDVGDELAEAIVRGAIGGIDAQVRDRGVRRGAHGLGALAEHGDFIARREHRRDEQLVGGDAGVGQGGPQGRIERDGVGAAGARGRATGGELGERGRDLGAGRERLLQHERVAGMSA